MSLQYKVCENCETEFKDSFKFCPCCGMKNREELTVRSLFYNTINNYLLWDSKFLKSFLPLMTKPGFLPKKFLQGKRLTYLHPAQFYLFVSVVFFFIFSFYIRETRTKLDKAIQEELAVKKEKEYREAFERVADSIKLDSLVNEKIDAKDRKANGSVFGTSFTYDEKEIDSLIDAGADKKIILKKMGMPEDAGYLKRKFFEQMFKFQKEKGVGSIYQTITDSFPIAMFFLLPIFAFLLKVFYFNKGRYAYHLVFSFYFFSFIFAVMAIDLGINWFYDMPDWLDFILVLSTYFYFFIAVKKFYDQGWFLSFIKSGAITTIFMGMIIPFASILIAVLAFMIY
ncbi:DUF3667 domain-containing protein [Mesoflavibacter zeaxanthinifaciens]|uniref:DUF3667 domain-containing protein n=1 Tax=Mesoflavibacter zeaxanthinifaciens TaxID=393060 RepID=UPI00041C26CF|nr:DUF3667 domain-containing protein [Mesoflavibacter zeaxanthinifaciens]